MSEENKQPNYPETFEQARAWAKKREAESGETLTSVTNPLKGLFFDLRNATVTHRVWDEDNNLVEMTYCAITGSVITKNVTKPSR